MSYYIKAYKGGKHLNLQIEEKHKYWHTSSSASELIKLPSGVGTQGNAAGKRLTTYNMGVLFNTNNISMNEGTTEETRIGNKISIKSLALTGYVALKGDSLITNFPHGDLVDLNLKFRILAVHFNETKTQLELAEWYNNNHIYFSSAFNDNSTWMDKLRESTTDTGTFKIIYDQKFTLGRGQTAHMFNIVLPGFNGTMTFDSTSNRATNDDYKNTYIMLIGPINYKIDVDATTSDQWSDLAAGTQADLANYQANIKLTYYDI